MATYRNQRILPIILVIVIIVIAVAALVSLAQAVFFSGRTTTTSEVVDRGREALLSTDADHSVRMNVRGPIVADEKFNSYSVVVSPSARSLTTYSGYLDTVVDQTNLGNNTAAYEQFVFALDKANLPEGRQLEGDRDDIRGVCASGRVYEFFITEGSNTVKRLWTSTCSGSTGSLKANVEQLRGLYLNQIPDASRLIGKVSL